MILLAGAAATFVIVRPSWNAVARLAAASLVWVWIDMEGPVLVSRGTHGIHLADIPVVITVPSLVVAAARLWWRRRPGPTRWRA
jgi:hypothetical protein